MRLDELLSLPRRKSLLDCFWEKTIPEPNSGCLLWTGCTDRDGYGFIHIDGKNIKAHRLAYVIAYDELSDDLDVLHTCDVPSCVEAKHLFQGTNSDNQIDAVKKGRNSSQKLTVELVPIIRRRYAEEDISQAALCREYGISSGQMSLMLNRLKWRHVA